MAGLVVFDFDGTLADSRRDLTVAVNSMRASMNLAPMDRGWDVSFIGNGLSSMVRRAVADAEVDFDVALNRMKKFYADYLLQSTALYPGVAAGLKELHSKNVKLALFSNKPAAALKRSLESLNISAYFCEIIGGDGEFPLKPAPDALNYLRKKYSPDNPSCWMVGDDATDMIAGRLAGFRRIFIAGTIGEAGEETPDYTVNSFNEFLNVIRGF